VCTLRWSRFLIPAARIYSDEFLKLDRYMNARRQVKARFGDHAEAFVTRMRKYADPDDPSMIFSDDIKNYLHLIEDKAEDISVFKTMLVKYATQNSLRFQTFSLGPVIMRVMFHIKNTDLALDIIKEEKLNNIFNESASYSLLIMLLYRQQKYSEALQIYELFTQQQIEGQRFPSPVILPLAAACYKLNSAEAYQKISEVYGSMIKSGIEPMNRLTNLLAATALQQGKPIEALELVSRPGNNFFVAVNLKLISLCEAGRVTEALQLLHQKYTNKMRKPPSIFKETLEKLNSAIEKSGDASLKELFSTLEGDVTGKLMETSLEEILLREIMPRPNDRRPGDDRTQAVGDDRRQAVGGYDRRSVRGDDRRQQYSDTRYERRQAYGSQEQSPRDNFRRGSDGNDNIY